MLLTKILKWALYNNSLRLSEYQFKVYSLDIGNDIQNLTSNTNSTINFLNNKGDLLNFINNTINLKYINQLRKVIKDNINKKSTLD